jgi:hypothetical protein
VVCWPPAAEVTFSNPRHRENVLTRKGIVQKTATNTKSQMMIYST